VTDLDAILVRLDALAGGHNPEETVAFVAPGPPVPKARARWSPRNNRWYTPDTSAEAERALRYEFRKALHRRPAFADTVALVAVFYVTTKRRKDVDNCLKLVMDAGTRAKVWNINMAALFKAVKPGKSPTSAKKGKRAA
jgi:Holliday junction resolvase RusA-like endonuclease